MITINNRLEGYIFGSAMGDALGQPIEFYSLDDIKRIYPPNGIENLPPDSFWTDDTQMMLAITKSLIQKNDGSIDEIMEVMSKEFVEWINNPGHTPGNTCLTGAHMLKEGLSWRESGVKESKGCGSVMRSGIIGYFYKNDLNKLIEVASASGIATHAHPTADAACIAGAVIIKLMFDGIHPKDTLPQILDATKDISDEFDDAIKLAFELSKSDISTEDAMMQLGEGWIGEEAFAMAMFSVLRNPDNYKKTVTTAINITGDSDSVGCIAGGISGAFLGLDAIPKDWIPNLRNSEILDDYITRLKNVQT
ncbi:MAG: ADP-ribosylglycohydrolase family protein [Candidatus Heimdallarchaeota archaeon]|nr:ADP-ribosylglycohydrolase family protein [Candidatus Heimdallarchaeota archaeon]